MTEKELARAGEGGGRAEVVEPPEHVVVPSVRVNEVQESLVGRLTRAETAKERPLQEVLLTRAARRPRLAGATGCPFELQEPSSTLIVVANDERTEPISVSQFQPPSSRRSLTSRSTIDDTSTPK